MNMHKDNPLTNTKVKHRKVTMKIEYKTKETYKNIYKHL